MSKAQQRYEGRQAAHFKLPLAHETLSLSAASRKSRLMKEMNTCLDRGQNGCRLRIRLIRSSLAHRRPHITVVYVSPSPHPVILRAHMKLTSRSSAYADLLRWSGVYCLNQCCSHSRARGETTWLFQNYGPPCAPATNLRNRTSAPNPPIDNSRVEK